MAKSLTTVSIEKIKPDPVKRMEVPDARCPGLYLVVQPSGQRSWAVRYRSHGKPRKYTIGKFPTFSLVEARDRATAILQDVEKGQDPATEKQLKRERASDADRQFESAVRRYILEYQKPKNRTWREAARQLGFGLDDEGTLVAVPGGAVANWGHRPVDSLTIDELADFIDRQSPVMRNRVLVNLNRFFKFCMRPNVRLASANPVAGMERPTEENARDRVLADTELRAVWSATDGLGYPWGPLVKLLVLTGQRRDEVAHMRWREIDGDIWTIPAERSKNGKPHVVHLSPEARRVLETVTRIEGSPFVFTTTGHSPVSGYGKAKGRVDAKSGVADWWFHDLRRTMATRLGELGVPLEVTEAVLNHISGSRSGVAGVYQRQTYEAQKYRAFHAWSRYVLFVADDNLFEAWGRARAEAENRFELELAFGDAIRAGGEAWEAWQNGLR